MTRPILFSKIHVCTAWAMFVFAMFIGVFPQPATAASADDAPDTINPNYPRAGFCIYVGAGRDSLFTALAGNTTLLIHGLAVDDTALDAAQQQIAAANLFGRVTVEKLPLNPMPYVRDLANLMIIDDLTLLSMKGLTLDEATRVLAPGGMLLIRKNGQWSKIIKARPPEMDEWTHPMHGPDGNLVSDDKTIHFPLGFRFLEGSPLVSPIASIVSANGRTFSIEDQCRVVARDAYNGLPLWTAREDCQFSWAGVQTFPPILTDGMRVYFCQKDNVIAADAATGQTVLTYPKSKTSRLLLLDGVLVASDWAGAGAVDAFAAATGQRKWTVDVRAQYMVAADGTVYLVAPSAIDKLSDSNCEPIKSQKAVKRRLVAVDLQTGHERWSRPDTDFTTNSDLYVQEARQGTLVLSFNTKKFEKLIVLNAMDGTTLWEIKPDVMVNGNYIWAPIVGNQLWNGEKKYELKTGKIIGVLPRIPPIVVQCGGMNLAGTILNGGRMSVLYDLAPTNGTKEAAMFTFHAARSACNSSYIPANGMYYSTLYNAGCNCQQGQIGARIIGFGPCGTLPDAATFAARRMIETGPAFGKVGTTEKSSDTSSYPIFRANAERSAAVRVKLASAYKTAWKCQAVSAPTGPLAPVWAERLLPFMTSPTVANNLVFVATREDHQVRAFHADTGKPAWSFTAGGRVDSPPTLHAGLALFGAHDGYLYALRAADGVLAWRTRLAPLERRMIAFGQIESVWPALGAVLVHDEIVYATAGRETEVDGGVALVAFNAATGKQLWASVIQPGIRYQNDLLRFSAGELVFHDVRIDPASGAITSAFAQKNNALLGPADWAFTRPQDTHAELTSGQDSLIDSYWISDPEDAHNNKHRFGRLYANLWAWDDAAIYGADHNGHACISMSREKLDELNKTIPFVSYASWKGDKRIPADAFAWRIFSPPNMQQIPPYKLPPNNGVPYYIPAPWTRASPLPGQITSMILTDSGLMVAGRIVKNTDRNCKEFAGFCCLLSPATGQKIADFPMPAVPTYEALAIADNHIYVSCEDGQLLCFESASSY